MSAVLSAYLQHGQAGEPMRTESVPVRESIMPWQAAGLTWTATGCGRRIPTPYMIQVEGRWRRVYCFIISNSGTLFIGRSLKAGTVVDVYREIRR